MSNPIPARPENSTRITLELNRPENRLDSVLLKVLRDHENEKLQKISRATYKELFNTSKILIKGQRARASSALAAGTTYVDILGY